MTTSFPTVPSTSALAASDRTARGPRWTTWNSGLVVLGVVTAFVAGWGVWSGSRSDYYASIALSMSQNWSNFFFGAFDPAGTVTLDKIPGSFWVPALFVKVFGFSDWAIILPNSFAAVGSALLVAFTAKRLMNPTAGLVAGAVVATTPILIAVSRSNQAESFFVLGLALTAWAAGKALERKSFGWLVITGLFVAVSFQTYMLEAWAVWPALAAAYLCTKQPVVRKIWQTMVAGLISLAVSVSWIVVVALIPAANRPYIGSTLGNDPWEMVFGYNGLGRFGSSTADAEAYRSFTPPFSGSAGAFRLFDEQVAGQIAWMIPAAILSIVILAVLRYRRAVTVFLGVWLITFLAMFSAVAGMHQFYTASLAVPMALAIGLAFAFARAKGVLWAHVALVAVAAVTAVGIAAIYGGYSIAVALIQAAIGLGAIGLMLWEKRRAALITTWTTLIATVALLLTPAAWSVVSMSHPSGINPVAGGVPEMSQSGFGLFGGVGGSSPSAGGFGFAPGGTGNQGAPPLGPDGTQRGTKDESRSGRIPQAGTGAHTSTRVSASTLSFLEQNQGHARYLVAVFGAQTAAGIIIETGGDSVLPIGGFNDTDPVPTLAKFQAMVSTGEVRYVLSSGQNGSGAGGGSSTSTTSSSVEIRTWVEQHCAAVTDASASGLYDCAP